MELIIEETGMDVNKGTAEGDLRTEEEQFEEISFDRCFYIYGILHDQSSNTQSHILFTTALGGVSPNEIVKRTTDRLETIHSGCVHRLSEMCCLAVIELLLLGKSVIYTTNKQKNEDDENDVKIEWPEDPISKAKIIRWKAQSISVDIERVST
ncbi:hypothetical protein GUJ93_ZPchr0013g35712 [Zizania palustris]|uniref:DUF7798 domain-containing protein n=1 Tax=Zizania palustris TaxID=103762 RepID=A0A8J5WYD4_ZIZPA|nr:hypothetical protein GUJ93_ZPchr0013g35712 [Zizania palustris]